MIPLGETFRLRGDSFSKYHRLAVDDNKLELSSVVPYKPLLKPERCNYIKPKSFRSMSHHNSFFLVSVPDGDHANNLYVTAEDSILVSTQLFYF